MYRYQVLQNIAERDQLMLTDDHGRRFLARPIRYIPEVGISLRGAKPAIGLGVLLDADNRRAFKLIFEQLDCDGPNDTSSL